MKWFFLRSDVDSFNQQMKDGRNHWGLCVTLVHIYCNGAGSFASCVLPKVTHVKTDFSINNLHGQRLCVHRLHTNRHLLMDRSKDRSWNKWILTTYNNILRSSRYRRRWLRWGRRTLLQLDADSWKSTPTWWEGREDTGTELALLLLCKHFYTYHYLRSYQ